MTCFVRLCCVALLLAVLQARVLAVEPNVVPDGQVDTQNHLAILIGCEAYSHPKIRRLHGPANDVHLMHEMLCNTFGFDEGHVQQMVDEAEPGLQPTRDNILKRLRELQQQVESEDHTNAVVVIYFAGHGSQVPEVGDDTPDEWDGLDEVFLASDAGRYDSKLKCIPGSIVDDELSIILRRISAAARHVLLIVDCCHAGTLARGPANVETRHVDMAELVPEDIAARTKSTRDTVTRGIDPEADAADVRAVSNLTAIYAGFPQQSVPELPLPKGQPNSQIHGLLTYSLVTVLQQCTRPINYRELVFQVQTQYTRLDVSKPTPYLESRKPDQEFLGQGTWQVPLIRTMDEAGSLNVGALSGLSVGSILALRPTPESAIIGFGRVVETGASRSRIEPVEYNGRPALDAIPAGGLCEVVYRAISDSPIRVAVGVNDLDRPVLTKACVEALRSIPNAEYVEDVQVADWMIVNVGSDWYLIPSGGGGEDDMRGGPIPRVSPDAWLHKRLLQLSHTQHLLRLAANPCWRMQQNPQLVLRWELLCQRGVEQDEVVVPSFAMQAGDRLRCRIVNEGTSSVYITLVFVDAAWGTTCVLPHAGEVDASRILPGRELVVSLGKVTDDTVGLEHMILIAVDGESPPEDLSFLAQPAWALSRGALLSRDQSPLQQWLRIHLHGDNQARGQSVDSLRSEYLDLRSWRVTKGAPSK